MLLTLRILQLSIAAPGGGSGRLEGLGTSDVSQDFEKRRSRRGWRMLQGHGQLFHACLTIGHANAGRLQRLFGG